MNIHHLELFHYVATHGGISRAVRHMPYGIQQPAVSSQILQLEDDLGTKLFERVPFRLTPAGEELHRFIQPFFSGLDATAERIRKGNVPRLRIGAAEMVLADYLPAVLGRLRKTHPHFRLGLQTAGNSELETLFAERQIDVALSPLDRKLPARLKRELLVRLPLALLVPRTSRWQSGTELTADGLLEQPLICLPASERICSLFQDELKARKLEWPVAIEASSLALLSRYVENSYGVGVSVGVPGLPKHPKVRALPLSGFPELELYAVWSEDADPLIEDFLREVREYVRTEWH